MIVIMTDGASKGNPGPASIGVIVWERMSGQNQRIVRPTHRIKKEIGIKTNNEAEWAAFIEGLRCALQITTSNNVKDDVYIYTDSLLVASQFNGEWKAKNKVMRECLVAATVIAKHLYKVVVAWVPRQLVYLADKEASKANG